jgi:hypothetical protein
MKTNKDLIIHLRYIMFAIINATQLYQMHRRNIINLTRIRYPTGIHFKLVNTKRNKTCFLYNIVWEDICHLLQTRYDTDNQSAITQ